MSSLGYIVVEVGHLQGLKGMKDQHCCGCHSPCGYFPYFWVSETTWGNDRICLALPTGFGASAPLGKNMST